MSGLLAGLVIFWYYINMPIDFSMLAPMDSEQPGLMDMMSMLPEPGLAAPMEFTNTAPAMQSDSQTMELLRKWSDADIRRWDTRNTRFQRDQDSFRLATNQDYIPTRDQEDALILNDPRILVKKMARLIARHPAQIHVDPAPDNTDPNGAQRVENFLYAWTQAISQRWMFGLRNPYQYDKAFFLLLRGWLAKRTLLVSNGQIATPNDPGALWQHEVIDPALVFPAVSGMDIFRVTHAYTVTWEDLSNDPLYAAMLTNPYAANTLNTYLGDDAKVDVRGVYWRDQYGTWWHAIFLNSGSLGGNDITWLKPPAEIGYNPWTIVLANGASYRETPWDDSTYLEEIGTGVLDDSISTFKHMNRLATKLSALLTLEADPPISIYSSSSGELKQLDLRPGARNILTDRDKVEIHRIGPKLDDYQLLWDLLQNRASRAGLPAAFFSEHGGESGFSAATILAAGKDILFPFVEAINQADALCYRKVLEVYRDFGPSTPLVSFVRESNSDRVQSAYVTADDITAQGTYVRVTREDMSPQELATRINLGLAMLARNAISLETFRKEWAKIENPELENERVLGERVYLNDAVVQALTPVALANLNKNQLARLYEAISMGVPPWVFFPSQTPQGLGNPNDRQVVGPAGFEGGLPTGVLPAPQQSGNPGETATAEQTNPAAQMNPILRLLTGGASGGMGSGGLPPVPGTTSPMRPAGPLV